MGVEYFNYTDDWNQPGSEFEEMMVDATEFTDEFVGFGVVPSAYGPYQPCNETGLCCQADGGSTLCPSKDVNWTMYGEQATFIWGPDLNFDNRIFLRYSYVRTEDDSSAIQVFSQLGSWWCIVLVWLFV